MSEVTRFAPSPTGQLHLGHVHAALQAKAASGPEGVYLVRLEDIDPQRCRPEFAAGILEELAWLGLGSAYPVRVQSAHLAEYAACLAALRGRGLLYPCFCSRAEIAREVAEAAGAPHGTGGPLYPGTCRGRGAQEVAERMAAGAAFAWRLDMRAACAAVPSARLRFFERGEGWVAARPDLFGDLILGRRDVPASYHLCVTHDDALQGVTLVTRGEDLREATHVHVLLQALMGWETPAYAHHRLLRGPDGQRLAKRDKSASIAQLRAQGVTAPEILNLAR